MFNFDELYKEKLEQLLKQCFDFRKKIIIDACKYGGIIVVSILLILGFSYIFPNYNISWIYVIPFIAVIALSFFILSNRKKYIETYKMIVIKTIIESIDKNLSCDLAGCLDVEDFFKSKIYKRTDLTDFFGFLLIKGKYKETELRVSKTYAYYETVKEVTEKTDKGTYIEVKKKKVVKKVPLFKGFLFIADFNKEFKSNTILKSKELLTKFNSNDKKTFFKDKSIKMENIDFNNKFEVFSEDEIETRYILSLKLMERILEVQEKLKKGLVSYNNSNAISNVVNKIKSKLNKSIEISFIDSEIYIMIPNEDTYLNLSLLSIQKNKNETKKFYETVTSLIGIVDILDLNTRIWSK